MLSLVLWGWGRAPCVAGAACLHREPLTPTFLGHVPDAISLLELKVALWIKARHKTFFPERPGGSVTAGCRRLCSWLQHLGRGALTGTLVPAERLSRGALRTGPLG